MGVGRQTHGQYQRRSVYQWNGICRWGSILWVLSFFLDVPTAMPLEPQESSIMHPLFLLVVLEFPYINSIAVSQIDNINWLPWVFIVCWLEPKTSRWKLAFYFFLIEHIKLRMDEKVSNAHNQQPQCHNWCPILQASVSAAPVSWRDDWRHAFVPLLFETRNFNKDYIWQYNPRLK